jgi:DNA polymerase III delta prime subunit
MTQKTKNILIVIGFVLVSVIAYKFAISNTLVLRKDYKNLEKETLLFNTMPLKLSALKQKEKYYDSLLIKYQISGGSVQNSLLKTINDSAHKNNLKVIGFIEPHKILQNDVTINTYEFTLEGDYNAIIRLTHHLEQQTKFGEIINLNFKRLKNYKTGKHYLQAHILLKSFG